MNRTLGDLFATTNQMHEIEAAVALLYGMDRVQDLALDPTRFQPHYICIVGG